METTTPTREFNPTGTSADFWEIGFDHNGDYTRMWREISDTVGYMPETFTSPQRFRTTDHGQNKTDDPFYLHYGIRLPKQLREESAGMDWREFVSTYAPTPSMAVSDMHCEPLRAGMWRFSAKITTRGSRGPMHSYREFTGTGPAQAVSHWLADMGRGVEMLAFHQFTIFEATATFLKVTNGNRTCWVMGLGPTRENSTAAAMSAAGERLYG